MLSDQEKALTSLRATIVFVCDAWLAGSVSTTYARTALEATALLLDKERTELASSPDALASPLGATLSEVEQQLARSLALLHQALSQSDTAVVRQQLSLVRDSRLDVP
jgi:hypothetical protein